LKCALTTLLQIIDQSKQWTNENFNKLLPIVLVNLRIGLFCKESNFLNNLEPSPIVQWEFPSRLDMEPMVNYFLNYLILSYYFRVIINTSTDTIKNYSYF